jgi:hypothetical protein
MRLTPSDGAIMLLFCPTEQTEIRKMRNSLIRLASATVHGVVLQFCLDSGAHLPCDGMPDGNAIAKSSVAAIHDR